MFRKFLKILIVIIVVVGLVVFGLFLYRNRQNPQKALETATFKDFIPFSSGTLFTPGTSTNEENNTENGLPNGTDEFGSRSIKKITQGPISGFGIANRSFLKKVPEGEPQPKTPEYETKTVIQYTAKSNSYVYESLIDDLKFYQTSNIVIPGSQESFFTPDGDQAVSRYFDENRNVIQTYWFEIPKPNKEEKLEQKQGKFLTENGAGFSFSPDNKEIALLVDKVNSASILIMNKATGRNREVFNSPFTEWLMHWKTQNYIFLSTKPSGTVTGSLYRLTLSNGRLERILTGIQGLTILPNQTSTKILYTTANTSLETSIYTLEDKSTQELGIGTLPEKCVWAKDGTTLYCAVPNFLENGTYPDDWYKGTISFNDRFWRIDTVTGTETLIMDPGGDQIDGTSLTLDPTEKKLLFINKKDLSLWQLSL